MGYLIGKRYSLGGGDDLFSKRKIKVVEVTVRGEKFLIRDDGRKVYSVVRFNDPWGEPLVQGDSSLDAADKIDHLCKTGANT